MKIRAEILRVLNGQTIAFQNITMAEEEKHSDSPLRTTLTIPLKDGNERESCYCCTNDNNNWCWNCEKPHCKEHARALFASHMLLTLCLDCAKSMDKVCKKFIKPMFKEE